MLSDGNVLPGVVHEGYGPKPKVKGRCLDLSKAYKQVPVSSKSLPLGVILVHDPKSGEPVFFTTASMPFGCSASVFSFNRISRSLLHLLCHLLSIVSGVFYDDYALLETASCCGMASKAACSLLDQLGWLYARDDDKGKDFDESFSLLGARIDLSELHDGYLQVSNKPGRKLKLLEMLDGVLASPESSRQAAKSIHGVLNFMNGSTLGQHLKLAARAFANLSSSPECPSVQDLTLLVGHTKKALDEALPRRWKCHSAGRPIVVLTDGSYEKGRALWGAVVLDREDNLKAVHHGTVPEQLLVQWRSLGIEQIICQVETYAAVLVRHYYARRLHQRRAIFFIDNEASRWTLIKASSPSASMLALARAFYLPESCYPCATWIERVPTASNLADLPSRGKHREAAEMIKGKSFGDISLPNDLLAELIKPDGLPV